MYRTIPGSPSQAAVIEDSPAFLLHEGALFIAEPVLHDGEPTESFLAVVAWMYPTLTCLCIVGWTCAAPERDGNYVTGCSVYKREQRVTAVAA